MSVPGYIALALSIAASAWCWRRIWRSDDPKFFKAILALVSAFPFLGPFFYLFIDMPPRKPRSHASRPPSAFLKHWNEREPTYLFWASFVFWSLALLSYWMNDWSPGRIIVGRYGSTFTEVDAIFFSLLIGAIVISALAIRAKVLLSRHLRAQHAPGAYRA